MYRSSLGCLAVVTLATISSVAEEAVTIKDFIPKPGQRVKTTVDEKAIHKQTATLKEFPPNIKEEVKTKSLVFIDEVLENSGDRNKPSKLRRTFEKAVQGKDGKDTKMAVDGKTIVIEKKDDKYVFAENGKELTGEARTLLEREFNKKALISKEGLQITYPAKVGDSTKIEKMAEVFKDFDDGGIWIHDKTKSTGKITLTKLYKRDKAQCAVYEMVLEFPITGTIKKSEWAIRNGKTTMTFVDDVCIDGSLPNGTMTKKFKFIANLASEGIDLKMETDATETSRFELLK
jgi:hypothetical protein